MVGCKPTRYPGIYKTPSGYRVRVRAVDPRTGTQKEMNQQFDGISMEQAVLKQAQLRDGIRISGSRTERARVKYVHFAKSLFGRKLAMGELKSAKTRERWADTQDLHLIPYFGEWYVDAIRKPDIEEWKAVQGRKIERKDYSPNTVNGWLSILLTTLQQQSKTSSWNVTQPGSCLCSTPPSTPPTPRRSPTHSRWRRFGRSWRR